MVKSHSSRYQDRSPASTAAGSTDQPFVSTSGRVVLEPQDWWTSSIHHNFLLWPGQLIQWQVFPMSADQWSPANAGATVTIASGLPNTDHTLNLRTTGPQLPIQSVIVERPPFTELRVFRLSWLPPYTWQKFVWMHLPPPFLRHDLLWLSLTLLVACLASMWIYLAIRRTAKPAL